MKRLLAMAAMGYVLMGGVVLGQGKNPVVEMDTSEGKIKIELFADKAPITVKNFLKYAEDKHYDGTIFHRVISNFMIQGGGFEPGLKEKQTRDPIKNESANGVANKRGTIAMARTNVADSATSQFFINTKDNPFLDKANAGDGVGYAVLRTSDRRLGRGGPDSQGGNRQSRRPSECAGERRRDTFSKACEIGDCA